MRANNRIYHVDCFRCCMCNKQLAPGDEYALKEDGILCKLDNEIFEKHMSTSNPNHLIQNTSLNLKLTPQSHLPPNPNSTNNTLPIPVNPTPNQQSLLTSTSCQNITNLQTTNNLNTLNNPNNKCLIKCEDLNSPNDFEGKSIHSNIFFF